ncbi:MAG: hypothetical protein Kow0099_24380 [Candidatus Abyssubacteria bacterium]
MNHLTKEDRRLSESREPGAYGSSTRAAFVVICASLFVYLGLLLYHVAPYRYNLSSLIRIGAANPYFDPSALEAGLVVFNDPADGGDGYDGQFYYYMVKYLFMGEQSDVPNAFRYQRILYPLLAYAAALGHVQWLPVSMPAINLAAMAFGVWLLWLMIRNHLSAPHLALYALNIGFLVAFFYDIATPLCIGLVVAGAYFYSREQWWPASVMLALSLLAQENGAVVVAALCLWLAWKRRWNSALILGAAFIPWLAWQMIIWRLYGGLPLLMSGNHLRLPFVGMASYIASFEVSSDWTALLREASVFPFMLFVIVLLLISAREMLKRPSDIMLVIFAHAFIGICFNSEQIWSSTISSPARALAGVFPFIILAYANRRSRSLQLMILFCAFLTLMGIARILLMPPHPFYVT